MPMLSGCCDRIEKYWQNLSMSWRVMTCINVNQYDLRCGSHNSFIFDFIIIFLLLSSYLWSAMTAILCGVEALHCFKIHKKPSVRQTVDRIAPQLLMQKPSVKHIHHKCRNKYRDSNESKSISHQLYWNVATNKPNTSTHSWWLVVAHA